MCLNMFQYFEKDQIYSEALSAGASDGSITTRSTTTVFHGRRMQSDYLSARLYPEHD
jgi:hypothetical protein